MKKEKRKKNKKKKYVGKVFYDTPRTVREGSYEKIKQKTENRKQNKMLAATVRGVSYTRSMSHLLSSP